MLQTINKVQHSIMHNVRETEEEFVFRTISEWIEIHVSKELIVRALPCFMTEQKVRIRNDKRKYLCCDKSQ